MGVARARRHASRRSRQHAEAFGELYVVDEDATTKINLAEVKNESKSKDRSWMWRRRMSRLDCGDRGRSVYLVYAGAFDRGPHQDDNSNYNLNTNRNSNSNVTGFEQRQLTSNGQQQFEFDVGRRQAQALSGGERDW